LAEIIEDGLVFDRGQIEVIRDDTVRLEGFRITSQQTEEKGPRFAKLSPNENHVFVRVVGMGLALVSRPRGMENEVDGGEEFRGVVDIDFDEESRDFFHRFSSFRF
jgi:hypothetical protein